MAYSSATAIFTILPGMPQTTSSDLWSQASLVVSKHIERADAEINALIAKRYGVPISPTPPFLSKLSEDITAYYSYRSFYTQDNHNKLEYFEEMSERAFTTLDGIRKGEIDLVDTSGSLIAESTSSLTSSMVDSTTFDYNSAFDIDDPLEWDFDSDLKTAVEDDRD